MDPINAPYAMEKRSTALNPLTLSLSSEVNRIKVIPMGSIIAATVCSPIKEDKIADIAVNPKTIFFVLFPVKVIIPKAICLSHPCLIIATESMRDPMMKKTASFIKE